MLSLNIREMNIEEIDIVRNIRLNSYSDYEVFVSKEHWSVLKNTLLSENDINSNSKIYVAEDENEIVGTVVLFPGEVKAYDWSDSVQSYPEIRMLAVEPSARKKGIARALMEHSLKVAKEEGNTEIGLHTATFMTKAASLYENMGFVRVPEKDLEPMNDGVIVKAYKYEL